MVMEDDAVQSEWGRTLAGSMPPPQLFLLGYSRPRQSSGERFRCLRFYKDSE